MHRALRLADSLVFPVCSYASDFLTALILPKKSFFSQGNLLRSWEEYVPERINQRLCRLLLSVHRKSSRLAVLGELGRYPLLVHSLADAITYSQSLRLRPPGTLVARAFREMEDMAAAGKECWLGKVVRIKELLDIQDLSPNVYPQNRQVLNVIKSKFDRFYLDEINREKLGEDGLNHNKLRFYCTLKGCFRPEFYIEKLHNREQRAELSRLRISAHRLGIELGRRTVPPKPLHLRTCQYCPISDNPDNHRNIDDERHLFECSTFANQQRCLFAKINRVVSNFNDLEFESKIKTLLCPVNTVAAKLVNKYIKIIFNARAKLDDGHPLSSLTFPPMIFSLESNEDLSICNSEESGSESDSDSSYQDLSWHCLQQGSSGFHCSVPNMCLYPASKLASNP